MTSEISDKLIWFQHLHKAGGTTAVELAKRNGMSLFPTNANGNPLNEQGHLIPLWNMSDDELASWISECRSMDVNFVTTEWGMPKISLLNSHPGVVTFVIFRDPLTRFLSNFNFDSLYSFTMASGPREYADSGPLYASSNYYTRILSRQFDPAVELTESDCDKAIDALAMFDFCFVLEMENCFRILGQCLGWIETTAHANRSKYPFRHRLKLLATGNLQAATRNILGRKAACTPELARWFRANNEMDCHVYEQAILRAQSLRK